MNRQKMIQEIKKLDEFSSYKKEDYDRMTNTELGAILGFWDIGDGGVRN